MSSTADAPTRHSSPGPGLSDSEAVLDRLRSGISSSLVENFEGHQFLPAGSFARLITTESVAAAFPSAKPKLVEFIYDEASKLFATVLSCRAADKYLQQILETFRREDFTDDYLPIPHPEELDIFKQPPLDEINLSDFQEAQWKFLAPIFSTNEYSFNLNQRCPLPFKWVDGDAKSGSGTSRIEIHEDHQQLVSTNEGVQLQFGLKIVSTAKNRTDNKELIFDENAVEAAWRHTQLHQNPILTWIEQPSRYLFISPWINGGNLQEFWLANSNQVLDSTWIREVLHQLRGLVDVKLGTSSRPSSTQEIHRTDGVPAIAFESSHASRDEYFGLVPEKILRLEDRSRLGTLKIYQPVSRVRYEITGRNSHRVFDDSFSFPKSRYTAPEVLGGLTGTSVSRSQTQHIWFMGCLMLEFTIWLLYGTEELKRFTIELERIPGMPERYFYTSEDPQTFKPKINSTVTRWIKHMVQDPECSGRSALGDLVRLVKEKLLVVEWKQDSDGIINTRRSRARNIFSSTRATDTSQHIRADLKVLQTELDRIIQETSNSSYLFTGTLRNNRRGPHPQ